MALGKIAKIAGRWTRITLTEAERSHVLQELVEENAKEFDRCVEQAKKMSKEDWFNIAVVLFDKQGTAAFTALTEALDDKLYTLRNTPEERALDAQAEKKYQEATAEPSLIDKTIEKAEKEVAKEPEEERLGELSTKAEIPPAPPRDEVKEIDLPEPDKQTDKETKEAAGEVFGKEWDSEKKEFATEEKPKEKKKIEESHPNAFKEVD